jgi:hypothetical protein
MGAVMDDWKREGEYGLSHPTGWAIGRYIVHGKQIFMLWHGDQAQGQYSSERAAIAKHATLTGMEPAGIKSA